MLAASREPIVTPRLELRRTRAEDAAAMFDALRDPIMYLYIPRAPPANVADVEARFARVRQEIAPGRAEQWLNWTVWLRETGAGIGTIEATVTPSDKVSIGYLFDPRVWRHGFAREAVAAMLEHLAICGAVSFEASIDIRNAASKALASSLGFRRVETKGADERWLRDAKA
jgi:[ribosomal protein S5]-alanine N-acetyltransferase